MFYELLINQAAATLKYNLARLDYARKYETSAHVLKWTLRVDEAREQFTAANAACLANATGTAS
jgi:hypothetical protein